ncbi:MAG: tripartite tricarboxylate transporter TctB family protein [Methyloligellaceae bacterium]
MRINDAIIGIALIGFALAEISYASTFPRLHGQDYGPNLFPIIIGVGLIVCGIALTFKGLAQRAGMPMVVVGDWAQDRDNVWNVVLLVGGILFYILISGWLGFVLTSFLILTMLLVRLGSSWLISVVAAMATTLVIHTLFAKVLLVPLPWGILLPVAW